MICLRARGDRVTRDALPKSYPHRSRCSGVGANIGRAVIEHHPAADYETFGGVVVSGRGGSEPVMDLADGGPALLHDIEATRLPLEFVADRADLRDAAVAAESGVGRALSEHRAVGKGDCRPVEQCAPGQRDVVGVVVVRCRNASVRQAGVVVHNRRPSNRAGGNVRGWRVVGGGCVSRAAEVAELGLFCVGDVVVVGSKCGGVGGGVSEYLGFPAKSTPFPTHITPAEVKHPQHRHRSAYGVKAIGLIKIRGGGIGDG